MLKKIFFIFLAVVLNFNLVKASHWVAGNIEWECLGNNEYKLRVIGYWDCGGFVGPDPSVFLEMTSSCTGTSNVTLNPIILDPNTGATTSIVTNLCAQESQCTECSSTPQCQIIRPGIKKRIYEATVTLQDCHDWVFSFGSCCRNNPAPAISNSLGDDPWYIYAEMNSLDAPCNSSPSFEDDVDLFICENILNTLNYGAIDPNGDSLVYSFVYPLQAPGTSININPGYTQTNFMLTDGPIQLNSETGEIIIIPDDGQVGVNQESFFAVRVDKYRNGQIIGTIIRDVNLNTVENCDPIAPFSIGISDISNNSSYINDSTIYVCAGDSLNFSIIIIDTTYKDTFFITSNINLFVPNSTFESEGINPVKANFSITPTNNDVGVYTFKVNAKNNGCPVTVERILNFNLIVFGKTEAEISLDTSCVGQTDSIQLKAIGGEKFVWSVLDNEETWLNCDTCQVTMAYPPKTVDYIVTSDLDKYNCPNKDTVSAYRIQPPKTLENIDICFEDTAKLAVIFENWQPTEYAIFVWNDDEDLNDSIFYTQNQNVYFYYAQDTVDFTSKLTCSWRDTNEVILIDCPVNPPNIFTPNNDGYNDVFFIENIQKEVWNLTIYNRWGKKVLAEYRDYKNDWTGEGLADGTYFYKLTSQQGSIIQELKGWVTIAR